MHRERFFVAFTGLLFIFAAMANGAHDLWASTIIYLCIMFLTAALVFYAAKFPENVLDLSVVPAISGIPLAMFLSFHFSSNPSAAYLSLMDWLMSLLLFVVAMNVFKSDRAVETFFMMILPCMYIEFAMVLKQIPRIEEEKWGTLVNGNLLVAFVLPLLLIFIMKAVKDWTSHRTRAYYWISGTATGLGCMVMAQSGMGWICLMIGLALYAFEFRDTRIFKPLFRYWRWFACVGSVTIAWIIIDKFTRHYDPTVYAHRGSNDRFYWWKSAYLMFRDYPWFGIGIGNFESAYLAYKVGGKENTLYAHSVPIEILVESGIVGFSAVTIFLLAWLNRVRVAWSAERLRREFLPPVVALSLFYTVNIGPEYLVNLMMLLVLFAIIIAPMDYQAVKPRLSWFLVIAGVFVAASPYVLSPFFASRNIVDGGTYVAEKNWESAQKSFETALALDSRAWEPYAGLARIAFEQHAFAQAVALQKQAIARNRLFVPLKKELEIYERFL